MNMRSVTGRIFAAFMGAALIIGNLGFSVAGYADESEDKTVLEMKAEKEVYKEGEIVKTIFSVRNDNAVKLVDVKATGVAPEGYAVKSVNGPSEIVSGEKADYIIEFEDTDVIHTFATKQKVDISSCFGTGETIAKYAITDKSQKKLAGVNKKGLVSCKKPGEVTVTAYKMVKEGNKKTYPEIGKYTFKIEAPKINLKKNTLNLSAGSMDPLEASGYITTENAKVTSWHTSNSNVVDVDEKTGRMTVRSKGSAKITAWFGENKQAAKYSFKVKVSEDYVSALNDSAKMTSESQTGRNAGCRVKINGAEVEFKAGIEYNLYAEEKKNEKIVVSDPAYLQEILDSDTDGIREIIFASDEIHRITLNEGNYPNTTLVINAPQTHFENHAVFKEVVLVAVSDSTYVESAREQRIIISENRSVRIKAESDQPQKFNIDNRGLFDLTINNKVELTVRGTSSSVAKDERIKVKITEKAEGSKVRTAQNIDLSAESKITLVLDPTAYNNVADVKNADAKPEVKGYGAITVTDRDTKEVTVETADSTGYESENTINLRGVVEPGNADVYLLNYVPTLNKDNVETTINSKTPKAVVSEDGSFLFDGVMAGNYYIVTKAEGYVTEFKRIYVSVLTMSGDMDSGFIHMTTLAEAQETVSVKGIITDMQDDGFDGVHSPIDYKVNLKLYRGIDVAVGEPVIKTVSNEDGTYDLGYINKGNYTLQITSADDKHPIVPSSERLRVSDRMFGLKDVGEDESVYEISVKSGGTDLGVVSFVLRWDPFMFKNGDEESWKNLDSHLAGPLSDGKRGLHIYSLNRENRGEDDYSFDNEDDHSSDYGEDRYEQLYARLDRDDYDYRGPETTTVYETFPETYDYYVFNASNKDPDDLSLSSYSEAYVQVFINGNQVVTYDVPFGQVGPLWHVCSYDPLNGMIVPVNKVLRTHSNGDSFDDGDIGIDGEDLIYFNNTDQRKALQDEIRKASYLLEKCNDTVKTVLSAKKNEAQSVYDDRTASGKDLEDAAEELSTYCHSIVPVVTGVSSVSDNSVKLTGYYEDFTEISRVEVTGDGDYLPDDLVVILGNPDDCTYELIDDEGMPIVRMTNTVSGITIDAVIVYETVFFIDG